jgi:hypothetical protein
MIDLVVEHLALDGWNCDDSITFRSTWLAQSLTNAMQHRRERSGLVRRRSSDRAQQMNAENVSKGAFARLDRFSGFMGQTLWMLPIRASPLGWAPHA